MVMVSAVAKVHGAVRASDNGMTSRRHLRPYERKLQLTYVPPGIWTSRGYGYAFNCTSSDSVGCALPPFYEESAISCIPVIFLPENITAETLADEATLALTVPGKSSKILFDSTGTFQSGCANGVTPVVVDADYVRDALVDFDVMDQAFKEHYAFFELRNVDWDALTEDVRATLTSNSTDEELFSAFEALLGPLHDGHVILSNGTTTFESKPHEIQVQVEEEAAMLGVQNVEDYANQQFERWRVIIASYMEEGVLSSFGMTDDVPFGFFGQFNNTAIGYMLLSGFAADNQAAFAQALDEVFLALAGLTAMVIDIRINGGGYDRNGLLLASHFVSERVLAYTIRAKDGDSYTNETEVYIEVGNETYRHTGPVIVIASGSTVSAAETFTLAMSQLAQTTLLGRNTSGAFSDVLPRSLPNGWFFTLSNEVYAAPNGTVYEMVGIPSDLIPEADLLPLAEREAGIDSWLELALEYLPAPAPTPMTPPDPSTSPAQGPTPTTTPKTPAPTEASGADAFASQHLLALLLIMITLTAWNG
jgi:carboxyl-terminal processing protease